MYIIEGILQEIFDSADLSRSDLKRTETNTHYEYFMALPGLTREDLEIKAIFEKDFLTVFVNVKKESTFVHKQSFRIVKLIEEISSNKEDIKISMENGILNISLLKSKQTQEYVL